MAVFLRLEGLTDYMVALALQERLLAGRIAGELPDVVVLLEHAPVITLGRGRNAAESVLDPSGVAVERITRGGDATWHAPGQLVAYPIVQLRGDRMDLHRHLHALEDAVIAMLDDLDIDSGRDPRNTGVWLTDAEGVARKVCSIGIACRRWVTWHGLALNVDVELAGFGRIRPCGFDAGVMTRLVDLPQPVPALAALVEPLAAKLALTLGVECQGPVITQRLSAVSDLDRVLEAVAGAVVGD